MKQLSKAALLGIITLTLSACGSSGDSDSAGDAALDNTPPTWTKGVFEEASQFKNRCENPRTGQDLNGDDYTDQAGSTLHEMHWLRAWSNNTYLWYDEIVDQDISLFADPISYFGTLRTTATTDSGAYRDQFHYTQDTAEYEQLRSGGASASYGARFKLLEASPPRLARVAYVEPNSPAERAGLRRGTEIVMIDGESFEDSSDIDTLNGGLYPEENGETHTFVVRHVGETNTRTINLTSQVVTTVPVQNTRIIETDDGKVGYLTFNTFGNITAESALIDAFTTLEEERVSDLVIDLRYNGGGYLAISAQLAYMVAGDTLTDGKTFERTIFNDKHPAINPVTGKAISNYPFVNESLGFSVSAGQPLPSVNLNRVFILSSGSTCSASESLINGLRGIDVDVVLIGDTTCGKPYGFYSTDNCGTTYSTIQFRGENDKGFGDYADGFSPENVSTTVGERIIGCQVADDLLTPLGEENEAMLKAALDYRVDGSCPPVSVIRVAQRNSSQKNDLRNDPRIIERELKQRIWLDNLRAGAK